MCKTKVETKVNVQSIIHNAERNRKEIKTPPAASKMKCGKLGVECLINLK